MFEGVGEAFFTVLLAKGVDHEIAQHGADTDQA